MATIQDRRRLHNMYVKSKHICPLLAEEHVDKAAAVMCEIAEKLASDRLRVEEVYVERSKMCEVAGIPNELLTPRQVVAAATADHKGGRGRTTGKLSLPQIADVADVASGLTPAPTPKNRCRKEQTRGVGKHAERAPAANDVCEVVVSDAAPFEPLARHDAATAINTSASASML